MIADTADLMGIDNIGIGSDLCQDQPDSVVEWMRVGRWTKEIDYGEGSASNAGFPPMPSWFINNRHFGAIAVGLRQQGFSEKDTNAVMGENWLRFYDENFGAEAT
jgi:microsomal dipeptidase-like Zn-dependent dipeptidase